MRFLGNSSSLFIFSRERASRHPGWGFLSGRGGSSEVKVTIKVTDHSAINGALFTGQKGSDRRAWSGEHGHHGISLPDLPSVILDVDLESIENFLKG